MVQVVNTTDFTNQRVKNPIGETIDYSKEGSVVELGGQAGTNMNDMDIESVNSDANVGHIYDRGTANSS